MEKEEIIRKVLLSFIKVLEIHAVSEDKLKAVKQQNFELAANLRQQELDLQKELTTIEELRELKKLLQ